MSNAVAEHHTVQIRHVYEHLQQNLWQYGRSKQWALIRSENDYILVPVTDQNRERLVASFTFLGIVNRRTTLVDIEDMV